MKEDSDLHQKTASKSPIVQGDSDPKYDLLPSAFDHLPSERSEVEKLARHHAVDDFDGGYEALNSLAFCK